MAIVILVLASSCVLATDASTPTPSLIIESATPPPTASPPVTPTNIDPKELVHLAWFYKPPDKMPIEWLPSPFDLFILTHKDEPARDRLHASGREASILEYLMLAEITDPGDCTSNPNGNQVAYKAGDFCQISEQHPDWFLLDQSGNRVGDGHGKYYMDPGNAGYQSFWLERARELQSQYGWNGIFIDNVEASLAKFDARGISLAGYPDDPSLHSAVEHFLANIRHGYLSPQTTPVLANIVSVREDAVWNRYMAYLDGGMIETFVTNWSEHRLSLPDWTQQMSMAQAALAQGKELILVSQGRQTDYELQQFAFASYLLIANGNAAFRYANSDSYLELWMYPDYGLELGNALGPRYAVGDTWRRDFAHGHVTVDSRTGYSEISVSP